MTAVIWHPVTGATAEVSDDAVWHHRQSGWLLASEREDHEARLAERAAAQDKAAAKAAPSDKGK